MRKTPLVVLVLVLVLLAAHASLVFAQPPAGDSWKITVTPYMMGAAMNGTTAVKGQQLTVDMSASDIFSNLQFGAMGLVVARKGDWGAAGDAIWMSLGATSTVPGPFAAVSASVDVSQGAFSFYGLRRLGPAADLFFGARVNTMTANLRVDGPSAVHSADGSKTWVDPIVGAQLHTAEDGKRWHAQIYAEVGGFGAGSTFTWQFFPTVGVDLTKRASLEFGYRWLDIDYSAGEGTTFFSYDVVTQGPVIGFTFKL
jgi:hypothetical protein